MKLHNREEQVRQFHEKFGAAIQEEATVELLLLRINLIYEEHRELQNWLNTAVLDLANNVPINKEVWINILDGMADLQVVLSGTAVSIKQLRNFDVAFDRVCESNMSKLDTNGKPILREDGKILKGPNYKPPYLDDLL